MDERQLLQDIANAPDNDAPRLVYADWLVERGDPRGELIHMQVRAASLDAGGERNKVRAAENKLLEAHRGKWLGPLGEHAEKIEYRRGFIAMLRMTARAWIEHASVVQELAPVLEELQLVVEGEDISLASVALARPEIARLRSLTIRGPAPEPVRALAEATTLGGLRSLMLEGPRIAAHEGEAIARASMPQLRSLSMVVSPELGLDPEVVAAIGRASFALEFLHIDGQEWAMNPTNLGVVGARAIADGRAFGALKRLALPYTQLGAGGVEVVASMPTLEALDVTKARIGEAGLEPLLASTSLREVTLIANDLGDAGATRIARSPSLTRWTYLHLGNNDVGIEGVQALADSPHARALRTLNLSGNGRLRDRAIDVLLASENLAEARIWVRNGFLARKKVPITIERKQEKKSRGKK